jgi:hypothetical protein
MLLLRVCCIDDDNESDSWEDTLSHACLNGMETRVSPRDSLHKCVSMATILTLSLQLCPVPLLTDWPHISCTVHLCFRRYPFITIGYGSWGDYLIRKQYKKFSISDLQKKVHLVRTSIRNWSLWFLKIKDTLLVHGKDVFSNRTCRTI